MPRKTTRNAQGSGSIRQRKDGTWEARFTTGRDPGTGKQVQRSVYGKTQKEVRQRLQQATMAVDEGIYIEPSRMTVGQWLDLWHAEYLGGVKDSTKVSYEQAIRNHLKPAFGAVKLIALKAPAIQKLYNSMKKTGLTPKTKKTGLSAKTIRNIHGAFHEALQRAVTLGYIKVNPSDACILPRVEKAEIRPLDTPDITAFLKAIIGHQFEALYKVDLFTGMREGELLGLQWPRVDFERGAIFIDRQLLRPRKKGEKYRFGPPKNDKPRTITPAPFVMEVLKVHRKAQLAQKLLAGPAWDEGEFPELVFSNGLGGHLSYQNVLTHLKRVLKSMGLEEMRFHDLRHTYAVSSIRSGDDIKTVQENLGHHTAAFTLDQYGHVTESMKRESAARMEAFISTVNKG